MISSTIDNRIRINAGLTQLRSESELGSNQWAYVIIRGLFSFLLLHTYLRFTIYYLARLDSYRSYASRRGKEREERRKNMISQEEIQ